jgi:hypothetical protein
MQIIDNLDKTDKFFNQYNLTKLMEEGTDNTSSPLSIQVVEFVTA